MEVSCWSASEQESAGDKARQCLGTRSCHTHYILDIYRIIMNIWTKFWNWYENKILGSVILIAIIQFIQIPHMVWNADLMLEAGIISRVHPVLDWFLYGVDLIEIVSIINVGMMMFSLIRKRRRK